ncbi:TetR/AcrR family transcriptional regulator [Thermasporomyces composti]|uniref:TetR family transcriptional regulator n=1 Tax=Thermasporomyces composti TaxID=696763 RepID=A0A3D9VHL5_THECX|nr:TetR/AcrR family transcriptional regulator [Thermasporomyces composti]REF37694.1 TetR family transcriptional regulator [Thermasporomyces composti]
MTTEYASTGDPRRGIELLWGLREPARKGPKPRLSVERIARAAIEIADAEGLAALSMRRVAERLGVTAMSLYTYVPSKAELLDVMLDTVYAEVTGRGDGDDEGGWRAKLARVARENWALYRRHPWLLQVSTRRPVLGPNLIAKYDRELSAVDGIGLTDVEMDLVVSLVSDYVHGAVRGAVQADALVERTGMTDEEWWRRAGPILAEVLEPERYPLAARVGAAAGAEYGAASDPERSFEFGLSILLDGIETLLRAKSATTAGHDSGAGTDATS